MAGIVKGLDLDRNLTLLQQYFQKQLNSFKPVTRNVGNETAGSVIQHYFICVNLRNYIFEIKFEIRVVIYTNYAELLSQNYINVFYSVLVGLMIQCYVIFSVFMCSILFCA